MQITRLRLLGFKSFVEPTELVIEKGLTGVVGPNGCGKSNLLEALRWSMGETSHKSMRAAAMEDVIFAGTTTRPARNMAEVTIFLDNAERTAPAEFNDSDILEVSRRIERDVGSAYRVNGRDVRARDVRILFEDAATGARSPALVRQGQIGEIVNAKPEQRRRILEDAAGVAGLHSRRHDAELRLKAAEANLARLADIVGQLSTQMEGLKRQARQARRYRELSVEIRKAEAVAAHVSWSEAEATAEEAETALRQALMRLGAAAETESQLLRAEAELADGMQPLREAEATRSAVLARLKIEQANFEKEAERAHQRRRELSGRIEQLEADIARESEAASEAAEQLERIDAELAEMIETTEGGSEAEEAAQSALREAREAEAAAVAQQNEITRRDFEIRSRRRILESTLAERREQAARAERQLAAIRGQLEDIARRAPDGALLGELEETCAALAETIEEAEAQALDSEDRIVGLTTTLRARTEEAQRSSLELRGLETERATLERLLRPRSGSGHTPVLDEITVEPGYEAALGAALGDDLDAPVLDDEARAGEAALGEDAAPISPMHWRRVARTDADPALPDGVEPLIAKVSAPRELARRLAQTGVVDRAEGPGLQRVLQSGQRLVSRQGDMWRWDGFVVTAEAPTAAAERLAQRNRLGDLDDRLCVLAETADAARAAQSTAQAELVAAEEQGRRARQSAREAQAQLNRSRENLAQMERAAREAESRRAALDDQVFLATEAAAEARERVMEAEAELAEVGSETGLEEELGIAGEAVQAARAKVMQAAAELSGLERERKLRSDRVTTTKSDRQRWAARSESASRQMTTLRTRADEARGELITLDELPAEIEAQRQRLLDEITRSEQERKEAADKLAAAESGLRETQGALRAAQSAVTTEREARARVEALLEGAKQRLANEILTIREALKCEPEDCLALAEFPEGATLPTLEDIGRQLQRLKADRDRLGAVNLAADQELEQLNQQFEGMENERRDVEEAIAKLRGAIGQLNREGKRRIDDAFQAVNGHFQSLFTTLFGGGEARLEMIEGEDPLEGGLEIIAKPPGKKPATLSLLSGGEQTLTALSLIFAVFLTNPSPICVLDEVDAPLDDSNVERYTNLMERMAADTDTRFLVITHHPMTMSRMNRLFGVTMSEKGVSQLVSVDLTTAERIVEQEPERAAG
jgi:chromosome segregation protein